MTPDWTALYQSILRCNAAYGDPATLVAAFEALGSTDVQVLTGDTVQSVLHVAIDGVLEVTGAGTRFSEGPLAARIGDLTQDGWFKPNSLGFAAGAYRRAQETWAWALPKIGNQPVRIIGHSLAGWEATAAPAFIPEGQIVAIHAWESPKAATATYWAANPAIGAKTIRVYHEQDPWWHWPFRILGDDGLRHTADEMNEQSILWIRDGEWEFAAENGVSGGDLIDASDHGPASVIAAIAKLAGVGA